MGSSKKSFAVKFLILCILFAVFFVLSFALGRYRVNLLKPTETDLTVIRNIRFPRIAAAAIIGAALSVAGAAYQGMFRNPMVSPDILGSSTGAGFGAALAILLGFKSAGVTAFAFIFGLLAVYLAYKVSRKSRMGQTLALVLSGVMISSVFSSATSFIKLVADTQSQLPAITYWLMGSLVSVKNSDLLMAAIPIAVSMTALMLLRFRMNLLTVSEAEARSMGVNTNALRRAVIAFSTLMTAACVSISGMIGWVGLVIPHTARLVFGSDYRRILPASAAGGALFLLIIDDIARTVAASEIPLGILTGFIGAPFFIFLIIKGGTERES